MRFLFADFLALLESRRSLVHLPSAIQSIIRDYVDRVTLSREYFNSPTLLCSQSPPPPHRIHIALSSKYRQRLPHRSLCLFFFFTHCLYFSPGASRICIEMKTFPFDRHLHCRGLLSSLGRRMDVLCIMNLYTSAVHGRYST